MCGELVMSLKLIERLFSPQGSESIGTASITSKDSGETLIRPTIDPLINSQ